MFFFVFVFRISFNSSHLYIYVAVVYGVYISTLLSLIDKSNTLNTQGTFINTNKHSINNDTHTLYASTICINAEVCNYLVFHVRYTTFLTVYLLHTVSHNIQRVLHKEKTRRTQNTTIRFHNFNHFLLGRRRI